MASSISFSSRSLIWPRTRFLSYRRRRISTTTWNNNNNTNAAICITPSRISHFNHHPHSSSLPLRTTLLLPPLRRFPSHLHPRSLSAMTTPQPQDSSSTKTERVVIKGRVQGVFYRNWTVENATQLGLKGWVRNRRDGSVEALFSGSPEAVQEMETRCRRGPLDALVTGFEVFPSDDDPGTGFQRKPTV